mmetsp:Transcript_36731/g.62543  ORF Transcript_36731/g.62543 Transcript_36731/m.62543 type:complete len:80 (-) Transcript_36731:192-431(-)
MALWMIGDGRARPSEERKAFAQVRPHIKILCISRKLRMLHTRGGRLSGESQQLEGRVRIGQTYLLQTLPQKMPVRLFGS